MPDTPETPAAPADDCDTALEAVSLLGGAFVLAMADFRREAGQDPDGSHTVAHMIGRVGEMARIAPMIRFRDTPAADDPAAAHLRQLHERLKRAEPILARLAKAG